MPKRFQGRGYGHVPVVLTGGVVVLDDDVGLEPDGLHLGTSLDVSWSMSGGTVMVATCIYLIMMSVGQQMVGYKLTIEAAHNVIS